MSMSSSLAPTPPPEFLAKYASATSPGEKESKASKLKRRFGVGKGKDKGPKVGVMVEPGEALDVDDEKLAQEWTLVDETEKAQKREWEVPEVVIERTGGLDPNISGRMPMPGDEEDEEVEMGYVGNQGIPYV